MQYSALIVAALACIASTSAKPSGLQPGPLVAAPVAYTAPIAQRNLNADAAPYVADRALAYDAPVSAPLVAAPFSKPLVAAPGFTAPIAYYK